MKITSTRLNRALLLLTTVLFSPALALAQTPPEAEQPQTQAEAPAPEDDTTGEEDEIVVLGRNIPQPMRETSEVTTFLSGEDLARQGDDNAALALTRLTGLSVVQSRFVYVRGLGDRYSSALLNGSPLPSPEPLRRQVPLDLFPSNILDGATVQKTFSPNYPGEFGGGIIDLRTLRLPSEQFFTIKAGTGGNTESTDKRGLTYRGEESDWTGISGGLRDVPGPIAAALNSGQRIDATNFTPADLEVLGESFVNTPLTVIQSEHFDPDFEAEVTAGASFDVGRFNIGLIGVAGYDSELRTQRSIRQLARGNNLEQQFEATSSHWDVVANGFGSASLGWGENEIALTGLIVRSTTKSAFIDEGIDANTPSGESLHRQSTGWYERQLSSLQLSGEHTFGDLAINWRTAFSRSTRDAPYERFLAYTFSPAFPNGFYKSGNGNFTRFSDLADEVVSGGVDATYTIALSDQRDAVLSAGYSVSNTVREYNLYSFSWDEPFPAFISDEVRQNRPDFLFSPNTIRPDGFQLREFTLNDDSYKGRVTISGAYASADVEFIPLLRAAIGVRYEDATEAVHTLNHFGAPAFAPPANLGNSYWLPAGTLTWNFAEDLQLRVGYSHTIARPQLRELAVSRYIDPDTNRQYGGNPFLTDATFKNYDARLEYYFGRDQFVTGGAFYKDVENPVEEIVIPIQPPLTTFINAPRATLYGAEIEYRTRFQMPFDVPLLDDETWRFAVNYTYTKSEIEAGEGDLVTVAFASNNIVQVGASEFRLDGSTMQGTPENIFNVQFGFETGATDLTLLVGWVDERILLRGSGPVPDVIERPGVNVDLVYKRDFTVGESEFTLGLSGRNLLDEMHEEFQVSPANDTPGAFVGRSEFNSYARGRSFSASLAAKF